eukprot:13550946-Ditylum_brightwellii.AAC.1
MASSHPSKTAMAPLAGDLSSDLAAEWANLSIAQRAEFFEGVDAITSTIDLPMASTATPALKTCTTTIMTPAPPNTH